MSRSYKKVPIGKDNWGGKTAKRSANKKVRRESDNLLKGWSYRKEYNSWDINDYVCYYPREEAIADWEREESYAENERWRHIQYGTLEKWLIAWEKMMIRK